MHGLLPDYHSFRGSYGGYAFPLWDRRRGPAHHNLSPALLDGLALAYGHPVAPEQAFDAAIALLSSTSYTLRFATDLEETIARIPFPASGAVFAEAARLGADLRALETFARDPAPAFRTARLQGRATDLTLQVATPGRAFVEAGDGTGAIALQADSSLRVVGVPRRVWDFTVSGYPVLHRFLSARTGEALDARLLNAILDVVWRLTELLHLFDACDPILDRAVARPLTRADLHLPVLAATPPDASESPDGPTA